jgi:hypothetical protein
VPVIPSDEQVEVVDNVVDVDEDPGDGGHGQGDRRASPGPDGSADNNRDCSMAYRAQRDTPEIFRVPASAVEGRSRCTVINPRAGRRRL